MSVICISGGKAFFLINAGYQIGFIQLTQFHTCKQVILDGFFLEQGNSLSNIMIGFIIYVVYCRLIIICIFIYIMMSISRQV